MEEALRMGEILQAMCTHIPTSFLLSSCSLVSKFWNNDIRIFIRDHRMCTFRSYSSTLHRSCDMLQELEEICGEIAGHGRTTPFNRIVIPGCCTPDSKSCYLGSSNRQKNSSSNAEILFSNLTATLKLKYMKIEGNERGYHSPLANLLKHKCGQLRSLCIEGTRVFKKLTTKEWYPQFPSLEELRIAKPCFGDVSEETHKSGLRWLLKDATNLKRILVADVGILRDVPEEMLAHVELQGALGIYVEQDIHVLRTIVKTKPCVSHIRVFEARPGLEDPTSANFLVNAGLFRPFHYELERILAHNSQSLKIMEIIGPYRLGLYLI